MAGKVYAMVSNGSGGIDWPGLPLACAYHGVRNVEALIGRLLVIKCHRTEKEA